MTLRGIICDLGHTLILHAHGEDWTRIRPRMIRDLADYLQANIGLQFDNAAFQTAFARQFSDYDRQRSIEFIEYTAEQILRATLDEFGIPQPDQKSLGSALEAFFAYSETLWRPVPRLIETLDELRDRGLRLGLVSNASDDANVQRLIDNQGLRKYFDPILVSAAQGIRKPNPHIFKPLLVSWRFEPAEVVMVGDTLGADVLGALNAGMHSVWVRIHAERPDNVEHLKHLQPDVSIDTFAELPAALVKLESSLRTS